MHQLLPRSFRLAWLASGAVFTASLASAQSLEPVVSIEMAYQNYIIPKYFTGTASVGLISMGNQLRGDYSSFVPRSGQILGTLTTPISPSPFRAEVRLPIVPKGSSLDFKRDRNSKAGVQVFAAIVATNLFGDSYLEQVEQASAFQSVLVDPTSGLPVEGTLLLFAEDNLQVAPTDAGKDGRLFTQDDGVSPIPQGYSLMRIERSGRVTLSQGKFHMSILEEAAVESPDFSKLGLAASFNALIDHLKERYAYTDLRKIDWEAKRSLFAPRVAKVDSSADRKAFYVLLKDLAQGIHDAHVQVVAPPTLRLSYLQELGKSWKASLGAEIVRCSDGTFMVIAVTKGSPAARLGLKLGSIIVTVNKLPIRDHLKQMPTIAFSGTEENFILFAAQTALWFPEGTKVELGFRTSRDAPIQTKTIQASVIASPKTYSYPVTTQPFSFEWLDEGNIGYVQWRSFEDIGLNMGSWEYFLASMQGRPGMIIDMRGNRGGLASLFFAMASYLFTKDKPASTHWTDSYAFDQASKSFKKLVTLGDPKIYSPRPDLAYKGEVAILVDESSASAAEFFSQYLQKLGRAKIVGEHSSAGAGGFVQQAKMPADIVFTYTSGRTYYRDTTDVNLEGKGVTPDLRVPITVENEKRKLAGEDVVLSTAIAYLKSVRPKSGDGSK